MKTSYLLNVLLAIALVLLSVKIVFFEKSDTETQAAPQTDSQSEIIDNIFTRTSVRSYSDRQISDGQIDTLLRAAMAAPTAVNKQPWQYVVIKNRATLDTIASRFNNIKMAAQAQAAVVVCGDLGKTLDGDGQAYWIQDCSAATENLLLAAHGLGLGAVWCGIYPIEQRVKTVKELLSLPDTIIPLNIIPIGYPKHPGQQPKDKYDAARIHYERF